MTAQFELVRAQYREIFRFVRRRTRSLAEAEDVTQEVFASAAESLARSAEAAPPTLGWLYTVARRRLVDQARRKGIQVVPLELVPEPGAPDDEYGLLVTRAFDAALAAMPDAQREVVIPRLLEGRSFSEIASGLGIREEACRMRFVRGLRTLRGQFEKEGLKP